MYVCMHVRCTLCIKFILSHSGRSCTSSGRERERYQFREVGGSGRMMEQGQRRRRNEEEEKDGRDVCWFCWGCTAVPTFLGGPEALNGVTVVARKGPVTEIPLSILPDTTPSPGSRRDANKYTQPRRPSTTCTRASIVTGTSLEPSPWISVASRPLSRARGQTFQLLG